MTQNIQKGLGPGKRQLEDETDEEIAGLLEESASLKKLIADIKELAYLSCDTEISEHQLRIVEVSLLYIIYYYMFFITYIQHLCTCSYALDFERCGLTATCKE
jgi:hypothetical protein